MPLLPFPFKSVLQHARETRATLLASPAREVRSMTIREMISVAVEEMEIEAEDPEFFAQFEDQCRRRRA